MCQLAKIRRKEGTLGKYVERIEMTYSKKEKYEGALIGAAIGDALGWPNEQNSRNINKKNNNIKTYVEWNRCAGGRYWQHEEKIGVGEYSDDTQLIVATARSLLRGRQWSNFFRQAELPAWLKYERGGGGATKRAAQKWANNTSPWDDKHNSPLEIKKYYLAGGNGVAMRILPHVFKNEENIEKIMSQVVLNGMYTHGHPRALIGAMLYAMAVRTLIQQEEVLRYGELVDILIEEEKQWSIIPEVGNIDIWKKQADKYAQYDYDKMWDECVEETIDYLKIVQEALSNGILDIRQETLEKLGCYNSKINGAGNVSVVIAIYLFSKYADDSTMAVCETANLSNADTDTLASMVGGLVGALCGKEWIPIELMGVQDYTLFAYLVEQMLEEKCDFLDSNKKYQMFNNEKLEVLEIGNSIECLPFGKITLTEIKEEKAKREDIYVKVYVWRSVYGQTIFSKKIGKKSRVKNQFVKEKNKDEDILFSIHKLQDTQKILSKVTDSKDFVSILDEIIQLEIQDDFTKEKICEIKTKWKKYKITKKQINSICNLCKTK